MARLLAEWRLAPGALLLVSSVALAAVPTPKKTKATPTYGTMVRSWHEPSPNARPPVDEQGRPLLVLRSLNGSERGSFTPESGAGGFSASDLDRASIVLHDTATGARSPIEPRLLDLVYRIQARFDAEEIRVLSGYRMARRGGASNHGKGRAIDFVVPGASDAEVAAYARQLGFVGVGIYPASGFVHLDVRDRSYFWSDSSGPGKRNRERGILGSVALASDRDALARGEAPTSTCAFQTDVDAALRSCLAHTAGPLDDDDPTD